jgi:hypothetical protein
MSKMVYVVKKNADFTEGRGPMLFDSVWEDGPEAVEYVRGKSGIYGSAQNIQMSKYDCYAYANGYQINEVPIYESLKQKADSEAELQALQDQREREQALKKLTDRERKLLGLEKK